MKILVTGANGFIGKNLCVKLSELGYIDVVKIGRDTPKTELINSVKKADFIFHLAGVNRPKDDAEFKLGNTDLTATIVETLKIEQLSTPVLLTSSAQAESNNSYGISKLSAEKLVEAYSVETGSKSYIYRLPNVFGKWCKPNYNSFVATFCYNTINDLPIQINDPSAKVNLVYIDDVCDAFTEHLVNHKSSGFNSIEPLYSSTVGDVASLLSEFKHSRETLISNKVGQGFIRALYSTYLSYFQPKQFTYDVPSYTDERGSFSEMLKTEDSGQFSFFTAHPGITRGGHYHHSKNEKFLVLKGQASFRFKHIVTGEEYELVTSDKVRTIVETVPGWTHDVTNIGEDELIVMLWANEIFDREKPDTVALPL